MIELKDNTPAEPGRPKEALAYVSDAPRILGLFHVLDIRKAAASSLSMLGPVGLITQVSLCACQAPRIPFHIKPGPRCVFLKVGPWFITARYWF